MSDNEEIPRINYAFWTRGDTYSGTPAEQALWRRYVEALQALPRDEALAELDGLARELLAKQEPTP